LQKIELKMSADIRDTFCRTCMISQNLVFPPLYPNFFFAKIDHLCTLSCVSLCYKKVTATAEKKVFGDDAIKEERERESCITKKTRHKDYACQNFRNKNNNMFFLFFILFCFDALSQEFIYF